MKTTESSQNVTFGSPEFWKLYDEFCSEANLSQLIKNSEHDKIQEMRQITTTAHKSRAIHSLNRPERGWKHHHAWLTLESTDILRHDGAAGIFMRAGDVIVVEHGWDRDVIITHSPISEHVCGYLQSGRWDNMIGLFLPLFEGATIKLCIALRVAENAKRAKEKTDQEARDWKWY